MSKRMSIKSVLIIFFIFNVLAITTLIGTISIGSLSKSSAHSLELYEQTMYDGYKLEIESQVEAVISILQAEYDKAASGALTEEQAQAEAKEIVRAMRYREDGSGYFWIDNTDYTLVMHPILPEQEGDNRMEIEDQNGVKILQEILKTVQTDGGGFNEFYYTKADGVTVAPKLAYSAIFEPWNWIVSTGNYVDDMQEQMAVEQKVIDDNYNTQVMVLSIISVVALILFIVLGRCFGNWLCNPIIKLAGIAKQMAVGKTDIDLHRIDGSNEIAVLTNSFCDMLDNFQGQAEVAGEFAKGNLCVTADVKSSDDTVGKALDKLLNDANRIFGGVRHVAEEIHSESNQIAAASQSLAQGSTEQASAIQQITASVSDIADKSKINAEKIIEVRNLILQTGDHLTLGNDKMREMVTAMEEINEASQNIQKVLKAIDDIAFNTNILALNATVEASRAGEYGKGFAVVAEEVRNLAGRSTDAASRTADMIEDSILKAKKGSELAQATKDALELISNSVESIMQLSAEVAAASEEQVAAVSQIDAALVQTSTVTQNNSAASEECAAASEQMANQAQMLEQQLKRFRLRG